MNSLLAAVFIYIMLVIGIFSFKPKMCFDKKGRMKRFGIGKNKTPFTFLIISIVLGIFSFVIATLYYDTVEDLIEEVLL